MIVVTVLFALLLVLLPTRHRRGLANRLLPGRTSFGLAEWGLVVLPAGVLMGLAMNPEARLLLLAIDSVGLDMFVFLLALQLRYGMKVAMACVEPAVRTLHRLSCAATGRPRLVVAYAWLVVSLSTPLVWIATGCPQFLGQT